MSRRYILLAIVMFLGSLFTAQGQENFESTVEVTKEYEGKLGQVQKSRFNTAYSDTLLKLNLDFDYSAFDRPYKDLYEFSPVEGIQLQSKGEVSYPVLMFKGGLSYPWMPEADLYIQPRLGEKNRLVFYGNHDSFWGYRQWSDPVNRSVTRGGLSYGLNWAKGEMTLGGQYRHSRHDYLDMAGLSLAPSDSAIVHSIGGDFRIRSMNDGNSVFGYDLGVNYFHTSDAQLGVKENYLDADARFGGVFNKSHQIGVAFDVKHAGLTVFGIEPGYSYSGARLDASLGLGIGAATDDTVTVYPKVSLSYEAVRGNLWLNAELDGGKKLWSLKEILENNPWVTAGMDPLCTTVPFSAAVGLKGAVKDLFGYYVSGGYIRYKSMLMFGGDFGSLRPMTGRDINELKVEAGFNVKTESVDLFVKGVYRDFGDAKVYMTPAFRMDASLVYNYMKRIYLGVNAKCGSRAYDELVEYGGYVDLGVEFTYVVNPGFSVFAKGKNLLNQDIFYVQDYVEPGVNFGLGVLIKL